MGRIRTAAGLLMLPAFFWPLLPFMLPGGGADGRQKLENVVWLSADRDSGFQALVHDCLLGALVVVILAGLFGWRSAQLPLVCAGVVVLGLLTVGLLWPTDQFLTSDPPDWVVDHFPWPIAADRVGTLILMALAAIAVLYAMFDAPARPSTSYPGAAPSRPAPTSVRAPDPVPVAAAPQAQAPPPAPATPPPPPPPPPPSGP